jgi:hypothetical protein
MKKNNIEVASDKFIMTIAGAIVIGFLFGLPVGFWVRSGIRAEPIVIGPAQELPITGSLTASLGDIRQSLRDEALAEAPEVRGMIITASYYADGFHNRQTANWKDRELFDLNAMTAAHRTLPIGTIVFVENLKNGRFAMARINDRGPFVKGRELDVSKAVAAELGMLDDGIVAVRIKVLRK